MSKLNLFVTICVALCLTLVKLSSAISSDNIISPLLRYPPYYSALGYDRPASLSDSEYQQLVQISEQYNIKLSDLYQLYDLADYHLPSFNPDVNINMIQQFAEAIETERIRRGLPYNRYSLSSSISSPFVQSIINKPYVPILQRRDLGDTLDNLYDQGSSAASSLYNNLYNMADYMISRPTQAFQNQINDILHSNAPQAAMDKVEDLASSMSESMRYMISNL